MSIIEPNKGERVGYAIDFLNGELAEDPGRSP
jgi:hypothetical protein